jgi:hypothetical protein
MSEPIVINLIEDASVETIKRLLAGLDADDCVPCTRIGNHIIPLRRIVIDGNRLVFEI